MTKFQQLTDFYHLEPAAGIEPTSLLYESNVLPLNYAGASPILLGEL